MGVPSIDQQSPQSPDATRSKSLPALRLSKYHNNQSKEDHKYGDTPIFRAYVNDWKIRLLASVGMAQYKRPSSDYFENVRSLLRRHIESWLDSGLEWIKGNRQIDEFLERSRPALVMNAIFPAPAEVVFTPPAGSDPAMEAVRLLLILLTSEKALRVKRCEYCKTIFSGRPNRKFCSETCFQKQFTGSKVFKAQRTLYMAKGRKADADQIIEWAVKSALKREKLTAMLNKRLSERGVKNQTIDRVTGNWVSRHWKQIESQRRK
jgi:hypothetical protein